MPFIAALGAILAGAIGVSVATATFIVEAVIFTAVSIGIGFIEKALVHPGKTGSGPLSKQDRSLTVRQPISPWRVIYGIVGELGGIITYIGTTGANNEYLNMVITLAGHQIQSVDAVRFDGVIVPHGPGGFANAGKYNLHAWFGFNLGSPSQTAITGNGSWPFPAAWDSSHRQRGRAHVFVQLLWDATIYSNGVPNITFDVHGHNQIYDPRGPSTGFSQNVALCTREFITNPSYGFNAQASEIDDTVTIASANNCDDAIALAAGGTEPRYTCNGEFDTSQAISTTLQDLAIAMAGDVVYIGGQWKIFSGMWRAPAMGDTGLSEADARDKITVNARLSKRDTCNGVRGKYISPLNAWKASDYPAWLDAGYVTEDSGEVIWKQVDFPFTTSFATAQRLAKIILQTTRRQVSVQYKAKLSAYKYQPVDTVPLTNSRFGWNQKTFKCTQMSLSPEDGPAGEPTLGVDLLLRETDSHIFDWAAEENASGTAPATAVGDPGTGIMSQAQLEPVVRAAGSSSIVGSSPLSATDAGASATATCAASFSIQVGANAVAYAFGGATNFTGKAYQTYYYLYVNDPGMLGGAPAGGVQIATDMETVVSDPQNVLIGWVKTPASGGGGTSGGGGGTGGGFCPCLEQWLTPELQVKDAVRGMDVDAAAERDGKLQLASERVRIAAFEITRKEVPCYRLVTENGVECEQSWDTPITQPDGSSVKACNALESKLLTEVDGVMSWSAIREVIYVGRRKVAKIGIGGRSFAHGSYPNRRGYTHNIHKT